MKKSIIIVYTLVMVLASSVQANVNFKLSFIKKIPYSQKFKDPTPRMFLLTNGRMVIHSGNSNYNYFYYYKKDFSFSHRIKIKKGFLRKLYPKITVLKDGKILVQEWGRNRKYNKNNDKESFYKSKFIILDKNGKVIIRGVSNSITEILPNLNNLQKSFYAIGGQIHPLGNNAKMINDYIVKLSPTGNIDGKVTMENKLLDYVLSDLRYRDIVPFTETEYLVVTMKDLLQSKIKDVSKIPDDKVGIYILDMDKKTFQVYKYIENEISYYLKSFFSNEKVKEIRKNIVTKVYRKDKNVVYFDLMTSRTVMKKNGTIDKYKNFICKYNMTNKQLKIIDYPDKYNYFLFIGVHNNILYFWNYNTFKVMGCKI